MKPELERKIEDCRNDIENIKEWISSNKLHKNVKFLTAYCVLRSCSTIEVVFKTMLYDFLAEGARREAEEYLQKMILDSSSNPKTGIISKYLEEIDVKRKTYFDEQIKEKEEKSDLNSLVKLRNDLAHGRDITVTINTVERYFNAGCIIVEYLEDALKSC